MKWIALLFLFFIALYGCKNNLKQHPPVENTIEKLKKQTNESNKDSTTNVVEIIDKNFIDFFNAFKQALKSKNRKKVLTFIHFPLHELHPCYLLTSGLDRYSDTTGVGKKSFLSIYDDVFDDESSDIKFISPDSLNIYEKDDSREYNLYAKVDQKSTIYEFMAVYANGRRGGSKSFFFGKIKGQYKLFWIACEGRAVSRAKYQY